MKLYKKLNVIFENSFRMEKFWQREGNDNVKGIRDKGMEKEHREREYKPWSIEKTHRHMESSRRPQEGKASGNEKGIRDRNARGKSITMRVWKGTKLPLCVRTPALLIMAINASFFQNSHND